MVRYDIFSGTVAGQSEADFLEVQHVRRGWMWFILIFAYTGLGMMAVRHLSYQQTAGQSLLTLPSIIFIACLLALVAVLIYNCRLTTIIGGKGIAYRFSPLHLHRRFIAWEDIEELYLREYDALSEYGGWGMKFGSGGKAYTVKGKYGLQLQTTDGRKILIGTQRPIELERLILNLLYDYEIH